MMFEVTVETYKTRKIYYMYGYEFMYLIKKIEGSDEIIIGQTHYIPSQITVVNAKKIYLSEVRKINE